MVNAKLEYHLRAKSRLRRLRSETRLRAQPYGDEFKIALKGHHYFAF